MLLRSCCCENAKFCVFKNCSKTNAKTIIFIDFDVIPYIVHLAICDHSLEIRVLFEMSYAILMKLKNLHQNKVAGGICYFVAICGSRLWRRGADEVVPEDDFNDF